MRALWSVVSVLALANLLAILGVVGWLAASDRLDRARIEQVRQIFAKTVAQSALDAEQAAAAAEVERQETEKRERASKPVQTSEERLAARVELTELDRQRAQRLRDEQNLLAADVAAKLAELQDIRAKIALAKQEFDDSTKQARETAGKQQFQKALGVLESMKPDKAKAALKETMAEGPKGKDQAVQYLDAMDEGVRSKIIQEFLKDDPKLAAELLEKLRTRGVPPALAGVSPDEPGGSSQPAR